MDRAHEPPPPQYAPRQHGRDPARSAAARVLFWWVPIVDRGQPASAQRLHERDRTGRRPCGLGERRPSTVAELIRNRIGPVEVLTLTGPERTIPAEDVARRLEPDERSPGRSAERM